MNSINDLIAKVYDLSEKIETRPYINTARIEEAKFTLSIIRTNLKLDATEPRHVALIKKYQACLKNFADMLRRKEGIKS